MIRLPRHLDFPGAPSPDLQRQPAGFDLTVQSIAKFESAGEIDLSNAQRVLPSTKCLDWPADGGMLLAPGGYLVTYNEEVAVPPDCAGIVLPRSSLMRCGATLCSALWDPGYRGRGQGLLIVTHPLKLHRNARIGQFVLMRLEQATHTTYQGQYQGENL